MSQSDAKDLNAKIKQNPIHNYHGSYQAIRQNFNFRAVSMLDGHIFRAIALITLHGS